MNFLVNAVLPMLHELRIIVAMLSICGLAAFGLLVTVVMIGFFATYLSMQFGNWLHELKQPKMYLH